VKTADTDRDELHWRCGLPIALCGANTTTRAGMQVWAAHTTRFFGIGCSGMAPPFSERLKFGAMWKLPFGGFYRPRAGLPSFSLRSPTRSSVDRNFPLTALGAAVRSPKLGWVARAFKRRYISATAAHWSPGPIIDHLINRPNLLLAPLHGSAMGGSSGNSGLARPVQRLDLRLFPHFRTGARNFFDHDGWEL